MRPVVVEGLGTAVLSVTACAAAVSPSDLAPLTVPAVWGALLVVSRRADAPGPFLNPALTAAAWVAGRLPSRELAASLAAQLLGGALGIVLGARAAALVVSGHGSPAVPVDTAASNAPVLAAALPVEALVVAVLAFVALAATASPATGPPASGSPAATLALVAAAAAVLVGPVTGGAFNPATAVALAQVGALPWDLAVAYAPAHLAGGLAAALVIKGAPSRRPPSRGPVAVPRPRPVTDPVRHGS